MRPDDGFDLRAARRQYWLLHWGLPPDRELRVEAPRGTPPVVAALGTLVNLELRIARGERLVLLLDATLQLGDS